MFFVKLFDKYHNLFKTGTRKRTSWHVQGTIKVFIQISHHFLTYFTVEAILVGTDTVDQMKDLSVLIAPFLHNLIVI